MGTAVAGTGVFGITMVGVGTAGGVFDLKDRVTTHNPLQAKHATNARTIRMVSARLPRRDFCRWMLTTVGDQGILPVPSARVIFIPQPLNTLMV